ncbi:TetR/AcrR family transcriptional regulator [Streptococcus ruminantium]|uniref:TetR/AcrR family transcriptional regulator n=1 Tax=Streptococcus ruminantium TaxID=1917441 RepID=UPI0012DEFA70|nr:TetR/AcrR family transcriptional regulator [Streptococcus ruminantium]
MPTKRQTQSKEKIHQALLSLLDDRSFDKISVADICRLAQVNRGTFYLHYLDKFDLIDQVIKQVTDHLYDILLNTPNDVDRPIQEVLEYISQNQDLILTLSQSAAIDLSQELHDFMMELMQRTSTTDEQQDIYRLISISGSVSAIIKHWLIMGCQESTTEMASKILKLHLIFGTK